MSPKQLFVDSLEVSQEVKQPHPGSCETLSDVLGKGTCGSQGPSPGSSPGTQGPEGEMPGPAWGMRNVSSGGRIKGSL